MKMLVKKMSFERALRTRIMMPLCGVSIIIINKTWLDDYYNENPEIIAQVEVSHNLRQPVILLLDQDLTPPERKSVDEIFQKHNVISKIIFDPKNFEKSKPLLEKALDTYQEQYTKKG